VAEQFNEHHQSPQVLLIQDGECFYEESHLNISYEEIEEEINFING
jgi:bacillithiol system protein YtxJ